jgi:phosphatidylserine/phosphatidylglycerophosphate/cardiolipin synthase-like enzyme
MSKQAASVSLLSQSPSGQPYLFSRINELLKLPGLKRFRAAIAYARWEGIGLIAPNIESLLNAGAELQTIYGIANGVTTPDSLLYSLYLQELYSTHTYAGAVEDQYANSTFHPKFFEFRFAATSIAIVGSANLTGAGLSCNTEIDVEVEYKHGSQFDKDLDAAWTSTGVSARRRVIQRLRQAQVTFLQPTSLEVDN